MSLDHISKKAESIRNKKPKKRREFKLPQIFNKKKTYRDDPFSFKVFSSIYPRGFSYLIWILGVLGAAFLLLFTFWFIYKEKFVLYTALSLIALFMIRLIIHLIALIRSFNDFRDFFSSTPFKIIGWTDLMQTNFPKSSYWYLDTIIVIKHKNNSPDGIRLMDDALTIFKDRVNKLFYEANKSLVGFSSDPRIKWKTVGLLEIGGSMSSLIAGEIYYLMKDYLKPINQQHECIEEFKIIVKGKPVKIESIDIDSY